MLQQIVEEENVNEAPLNSLTIQDVQAIKAFLEKEITGLEAERSIYIGCAKSCREQEDKTMFYETAKKHAKRISQLAKVQKKVKKFLTDSHV